MKITYARMPEKINKDLKLENGEWVWELQLYGQPDFTTDGKIRLKLGKDKEKATKEVTKLCQNLIRSELYQPHLRVGVLYSNRETICYIAKIFSNNWCDVQNGFSKKTFTEILRELETLRPCF